MYDPLTAKRIPIGHQGEVKSYWAATTPPYQPRQRPCPEQADVVIIGAGYTGLNAAYQLAYHYQQRVLLLDAGSVGAGCSGRNAGFVLPGSGRLSYSDYQTQYGDDIAKAIQNEFAESIEHISKVTSGAAQSVELRDAEYLRFAHSPQQQRRLQQQQPLYKSTLLNAQWLDEDIVRERFPGIHHAYGGLTLTPAKSINPLAYANLLAMRAEKAGVHIKTNTPVLHYHLEAEGYRVQTSTGNIRCKKLLFCTNGYLPTTLAPYLSARHLPVLSSVLVTEKLTPSQQNNLGLHAGLLAMDTRLLKYYYRLLPDGRLLFGGRGAIQGKDAEKERYLIDLRRALTRTLPSLANIQVEYHWHGWISVALDNKPHLIEAEPNVYACMGYCGAGIAFASLAGKRLAAYAMQDKTPDLPFYREALPKFPLPRLRRLGQWLFYQYGQWKE